MSDFKSFAAGVNAAFNRLASRGELYIAGDGDRYALEKAYLAAFPEGTNPKYITNTEHDCVCCKNFLRNIGSVVAINDDYSLSTIWDDYNNYEYPYNVVAERLSFYLRFQPIHSLFRTSESKFGAERTKQVVNGSVINWNHFFAEVPSRFRTSTPDALIGGYRTSVEMLDNAICNIELHAVETIIQLIDENQLYRGAEFGGHVRAFHQLLLAYEKLPAERSAWFCWKHGGEARARFKNTAIGTLAVDLSVEGADGEQAIRAFESKVAPTNYKRPTAAITNKMVDNAMVALKKLELEDAIPRRLATRADISINNVLWAANKVGLKNSLEDLLKAATKPTSTAASKTYTLQEFLDDVLPSAKKIQILLDGRHASNFMTLTTAKYQQAPKLFKWDNEFAWSYDGSVTDSIAEKVKKAGGNIDAIMRVSLAWFNRDDLDLAVVEPNGSRIYFANKQGKLDVDMNCGSIQSTTPVENISWCKKPEDGIYSVIVNQFNRRTTEDVGFELEVKDAGTHAQFSYPKAVVGDVLAMNMLVKNGKIEKFLNVNPALLPSRSSEKWGLKFNAFHDVDLIALSPNHWGEKPTGNKHVFFIVDGCRTVEDVRGIYNEFLRSDLEEHRKVFEVLGGKTKCEPSDEQLSGLGFSSTKPATITLAVDGRNINVTI